MIPKKVRIGLYTFKVIITEQPIYRFEEDGAKYLDGRINTRLEQIQINGEDTTERTRVQVLMHEIIHGILNQGGFQDHNEEFVECLSFGLIPLIRDNPDLIKAILDFEVDTNEQPDESASGRTDSPAPGVQSGSSTD